MDNRSFRNICPREKQKKTENQLGNVFSNKVEKNQ